MKGVVPVATMADLIAKKQRFESRTPASRDLLSPRSPVPQLSNKVKREQGSGEKVKGPSRPNQHVKAEPLEIAESGAPEVRKGLLLTGSEDDAPLRISFRTRAAITDLHDPEFLLSQTAPSNT